MAFATLPLLLTTGFLGQRTVRVKALQLALWTISAAPITRTVLLPAYLAVTSVRLSCRRTRTVLLNKDWIWIQTFDEDCILHNRTELVLWSKFRVVTQFVNRPEGSPCLPLPHLVNGSSVNMIGTPHPLPRIR